MTTACPGEQQLKKIEAMIGSMTQQERENPDLLAAQPSRRRRIARGSGHQPADVDKVLADFQKMRGFMQQMTQERYAWHGWFPWMGGDMPGMGGFWDGWWHAGMPGGMF